MLTLKNRKGKNKTERQTKKIYLLKCTENDQHKGIDFGLKSYEAERFDGTSPLITKAICRECGAKVKLVQHEKTNYTK